MTLARARPRAARVYASRGRAVARRALYAGRSSSRGAFLRLPAEILKFFACNVGLYIGIFPRLAADGRPRGVVCDALVETKQDRRQVIRSRPRDMRRSSLRVSRDRRTDQPGDTSAALVRHAICERTTAPEADKKLPGFFVSRNSRPRQGAADGQAARRAGRRARSTAACFASGIGNVGDCSSSVEEQRAVNP